MQNRFWLVMKTAAGGERPFPVNKDRMVIGQEASSDLRVPLPRIAPRHCEIVLASEGLRLTDLGSAEGTLHNGNRVRQAMLVPRDRVTIGPVTFEVRMGNGLAPPAMGPPPSVTEVKPSVGPARTPKRP